MMMYGSSRRDARIEDRDDVGMPREAPHRSALPFEAHCRRVVELPGENLHRDFAVEARLAGAVHGAVAAAADEDRVGDAVDARDRPCSAAVGSVPLGSMTGEPTVG